MPEHTCQESGWLNCFACARNMRVRENTAVQTPQAMTYTEPADLTQIPYEAERRLGLIFVEGAPKYGRGNWRSGARDRAYQLERANHALKHLKIYLHCLEFGEDLGEPGEDNLAKVAWFCVTQMELERLEKAQLSQEKR